MSRVSSRRRFLARSTTVLAGLGAAIAPAGVRTLEAIEPIPRTAAARFKFSLAAYSYRSLLEGVAASWTLSDFIDECARLGLDGTELTSYYFPERFTTADLLDWKHHCIRLGLGISGTAVRNDFGLPDGPQREAELAHVRQWIDRTAVLGAPVIRVFAGHRPADTSDDETHRRIVAGLETCCAHASERGVFVALENHGGPTSSVEGLLRIVRDVQSPWFGVNLDTGNFHSDDVYADLARAAPYAVNVQVKVVVSDAAGRSQPTDYGRLAQVLRDARYRGYVVLEYEESEDPRTACPRHLEALRRGLTD